MADQKLTERTEVTTSLDADLTHVVQGGVSYKHTKANLLKEDRARLTALEAPDYTTQGNTFNGNDQLVQLESDGKLPAIDGSQLTNLPGAPGLGTVTSVVAGDGLDFTTITNAGSVTMGTPASTTGTTINAVSTTSHTHDLDLTNATDLDPANVTIADAGGIITATEVEGALQENRTAINLNTAKVTNVSTNLSEGTTTNTTVDVNSSDGTNATLVAASTSRAGVMTKVKFDEVEDNKNKVLIIAFSDETTAIDAATGKVTFTMPNFATTLTDIAVSFVAAPTTSAITIDINEAGTSVLSTKITVDATEFTSETAATPPVISDSSLAANAIMSVDVDTADSGGTSAGGKLLIYYTKA